MKVGLVVLGLPGFVGVATRLRSLSLVVEQPVQWIVGLALNILLLVLVYGTWQFKRWAFASLVAVITADAVGGVIMGAHVWVVMLFKVLPLLLIARGWEQPRQTEPTFTQPVPPADGFF